MTTDSSSAADGGLFSLAQIQHLMRVEFNRAQRYGYPITCLMIAVDRLGHLRDLYGYESKEEILEGVIDLLKSRTRSSDFLGRLADDRLLAVVPHTDAAGAETLATRLIGGVRELEFSTDGRTLGATLSVGGSSDQAGETLFFDALLDSAEAALFEAQQQGGDRFVALAPGAVQ